MPTKVAKMSTLQYLDNKTSDKNKNRIPRITHFCLLEDHQHYYTFWAHFVGGGEPLRCVCVVGGGGIVDKKYEKKKKKHIPRARTTHLALFGPVYVVTACPNPPYMFK